MTDFLDRFGSQLTEASRILSTSRPATARRRTWRPRRRAALGVASLLIATPALAAIQPWSPLLGRPTLHNAPPGTSATPPPQEQLAVFSVLRRPQNAQDRSPATQALLAHLGVEQGGVRTASIRLLSPPVGSPVVLVSVERSVNPADGTATDTNELCLLFGHGGACSSQANVIAGRFIALAGRRDFGLAPDGVAQVILQYQDGQTRSAVVRDNLFEIADAPTGVPVAFSGGDSSLTPPTPPRPLITWLDANGRVIAPSQDSRSAS